MLRGASEVVYVASVVITMHNAESTIRTAISSALAGFTAVELIVCDDASSDKSVRIVKNLRNPSIRLIENRSNLGPGPSRDAAIAESRSPWIALLDADDAWSPGRLDRLLSVAGHTNADVVFDNTMLCHDKHGRLISWKALHGPNAFGGCGSTLREVAIIDYISSPRLLIHPLIRTDFIRKHGIRHSSRRFAEDAEFYLRLALAGAKFAYVPEPLYHYRITPGSLTAQAKDPTLMRKCLEECSQWEGWLPAVQEAFGNKIASLRHNEALYDLRRAVRQGQFAYAFKLLAMQPRLLTLLPPRIFQQLRYQAHRISHGGIGR